jgi:hypothetical protein
MKTSGISFSGYVTLFNVQNIDEARKKAEQINKASGVSGNTFFTTPTDPSPNVDLIVCQSDNDLFEGKVLPAASKTSGNYASSLENRVDGSWQRLDLGA